MIDNKKSKSFINNKTNYKIVFTINFTQKTIQLKHCVRFLSIKKRHLISIEKIHSIRNIYTFERKKIQLKNDNHNDNDDNNNINNKNNNHYYYYYYYNYNNNNNNYYYSSYYYYNNKNNNNNNNNYYYYYYYESILSKTDTFWTLLKRGVPVIESQSKMAPVITRK